MVKVVDAPAVEATVLVPGAPVTPVGTRIDTVVYGMNPPAGLNVATEPVVVHLPGMLGVIVGWNDWTAGGAENLTEIEVVAVTFCAPFCGLMASSRSGVGGGGAGAVTALWRLETDLVRWPTA